MKRRNSLKKLGLVSSSLLLPTYHYSKTKIQPGWLDEFKERWKVSELYNREVFNAMPEEFLDYKPVPEVMSFGKQFLHIAMGCSIYSSVIKSDDPLTEPDKLEKNVILKYLEETSSEFNSVLSGLDDKDLQSTDHKYKNEEMWKEFSIGDILLLAYHHTAHHRGQAIVYLRLKGIEPPKYRF